MSGVILNAGQHKDFIVPITNFYNLKKCSTYRIYAYVEHNMFEDVYRTKDTTFEVNKGTVVWEQPVGIPEFMLAKKKEKIKKRTYKLNLWPLLDSISYKNVNYYDTLTVENLKEYSPYVVMRWLTGGQTSDVARQICYLNEFVNP